MRSAIDYTIISYGFKVLFSLFLVSISLALVFVLVPIVIVVVVVKYRRATHRPGENQEMEEMRPIRHDGHESEAVTSQL